MTMTNTQAPAVRLRRTIAAPPERVFRAWLDPDLLRRWMHAGDLTVTRVEVDERPGGRLGVWQAGPDGDAGGFEATITEIVPHERLVFDWQFLGPQRDAHPGFDTRLTVTLRPVDDGTELTLVHERLEALRAAMPQVAERVAPGWERALDGLEAALSD